MPLAIFDLDHTLLQGDSDVEWGRFLVDQGHVDGEVYERENERFYEEYKVGTLDILEFLAFSLKPLAEHDRQTLEAWRREFMATRIRPLITPAALALVERHRQAGNTLIIITATNHFVTQPIAEHFGIPHLIATDPEEQDGRYTGGVAGTPCYREGKVTRIRAWLAEQNADLDRSYFYSDSHNDLPLLEEVTYPHAVNPDDELASTAKARGWPILDLS